MVYPNSEDDENDVFSDSDSFGSQIVIKNIQDYEIDCNN